MRYVDFRRRNDVQVQCWILRLHKRKRNLGARNQLILYQLPNFVRSFELLQKLKQSLWLRVQRQHRLVNHRQIISTIIEEDMHLLHTVLESNKHAGLRPVLPENLMRLCQGIKCFNPLIDTPEFPSFIDSNNYSRKGSNQDKAFEEIEDQRLSATYNSNCSWPSPVLLARIARIAAPAPSSSSQSPCQHILSTCPSPPEQVDSAVLEQRMTRRMLELKDLRVP